MKQLGNLRLSGLVKESVVDGPGLRLTVFTQGCPHHCPGCHNPDTHDFEGGYNWDAGEILVAFHRNPLLQGLTLSGGEPFCQAKELLPLAREVRLLEKDVVCYTGYTLEELLAMAEEQPEVAGLLEQIDLLIDGRYHQEERDLTLRFRGSRNQRVLQLPASLEKKEAVWAEGYQ